MKMKINKKYSNLFLIIFVIIGSFLLAKTASAEWYLDLLGGIANILVSVFGWILSQVMVVLIYIAQYNNFINPAVSNGWVIVRNICNMFFVVILLVIAFATILHLENYSYKKWLPKLILMAVLINFSKTICGILIDIAQVVMLTFVNAFKDIGALNLTKMLGIADWQSLKGFSEISDWEAAAAMVLAVIYSVVSLIVITAMLAMLVMRIVMIWIYVVLSPLAYLLSAFPGGQSYASEWWKEFTKNLIIGPVLAFFIWLSFTALANFNSSSLGITGTLDSDNNLAHCKIGKNGTCEYGTSTLLIQFVIAIGMLLGGLKIAQEIGGAAGSVAGKVASKGKKLAIGGAALAGVGAWKAARQPFIWGTDKLQEKGIVDLNVKRAWNTMQARRKEKKEEQFATGQVNAARRMREGGRMAGIFAMSANAGDAWDELSDWKGIKPTGIIQRVKGGRRMTKNRTKAEDEKRPYDEELDLNNFRMEFVSATDNEFRNQKIKELNNNINLKDSQIKNEQQKGDQADSEKIARFEHEKSLLEAKKDFAVNNIDNVNNLASQLDMDVFKSDFADSSEEERYSSLQGIRQEIVRQQTFLQDPNIDADVRLNIQQKINDLEQKKAFGENNYNHDFSDAEKNNFNQNREASKIAFRQGTNRDAIIAQTQDIEKEIKARNSRIERNTPAYSFEARAAEQKMVAKRMSDVKDITDPTELLVILLGAIKSHDKNMVKAIMLKMTKDYNDNTFLQPLVGNTGHTGLKQLMRDLADKKSENYAGFGEQEAFSLGSQIAEINKNTNHWGATSAYTMENGKFRETTDEEHNRIRTIETGKIQLQAFCRNNNRLAYGFHNKFGEFNLDANGVMMCQRLDTEAGHKNMETMNESAAKHIYDAIMRDSKLISEFSKVRAGNKSFLQALESRLGEIAKGSFENNYSRVMDLGYQG